MGDVVWGVLQGQSNRSEVRPVSVTEDGALVVSGGGGGGLTQNQTRDAVSESLAARALGRPVLSNPTAGASFAALASQSAVLVRIKNPTATPVTFRINGTGGTGTIVGGGYEDIPVLANASEIQVQRTGGSDLAIESAAYSWRA